VALAIAEALSDLLPAVSLAGRDAAPGNGLVHAIALPAVVGGALIVISAFDLVAATLTEQAGVILRAAIEVVAGSTGEGQGVVNTAVGGVA